MAAGALTLAITAAFATKVNKKFTQVSSAYFNNGSSWYITSDGGTSGLLTTKATTPQLKMMIYYTQSGATQLGGASVGSLITVVNTSSNELVHYR